MPPPPFAPFSSVAFFAAFELACVAVVTLTLAAMARARGWPLLLRDYIFLAAGAWLGEDTCVALYRFYAYAPGWHIRLHHVPVLVPLIWPLVILSARDVVSALWPSLHVRRALHACAVGALVVFDASLVEVVAVRAGLWSWAEAGHLGVPIIGILGWGFFAAGADVGLSSRRPALAIALGPLAAHALIDAAWWALFRWIMRGDLGAASLLGVAAVALVALTLALAARRRGSAIPLAVAAPRMIAASLFVALLVVTAPADAPLWAHAAAVAVPYFAATSFVTRRCSPGDPRGSTAPSPR